MKSLNHMASDGVRVRQNHGVQVPHLYRRGNGGPEKGRESFNASGFPLPLSIRGLGILGGTGKQPQIPTDPQTHI